VPQIAAIRIALFKAAFHCRGRLWNEISHGLLGHIVTHLIQNDQNQAKYLAFSFGNSRGACMKVYVTLTICEFNHWLDCQTATWDDMSMMNIMPGEEVIAEA
jgi:hypothetical protein